MLAKKYYIMGAELEYLKYISNLGEFYQKIEQNYDEMKKIYHTYWYCVKRCECMAYYYKNIKKNFIKIEKYYRMAFDNGDNTSMHQLALYYKYNKKDYNKMNILI